MMIDHDIPRIECRIAVLFLPRKLIVTDQSHVFWIVYIGMTGSQHIVSFCHLIPEVKAVNPSFGIINETLIAGQRICIDEQLGHPSVFCLKRHLELCIFRNEVRPFTSPLHAFHEDGFCFLIAGIIINIPYSVEYAVQLVKSHSRHGRIRVKVLPVVNGIYAISRSCHQCII